MQVMGNSLGLAFKGRGKQPKAPQFDYNRAIQDQIRYNRPNISGPGGSQTYGTDANGNTTFNTSLSPQLQALFDRGTSMAAQPLQRYQAPEGMGQLLASVMQRVNRRSGGSP
jgi:hypothetical protein